LFTVAADLNSALKLLVYDVGKRPIDLCQEFGFINLSAMISGDKQCIELLGAR
jgi:hypothetical protein